MKRQTVGKIAREHLLSELPGFSVTRGIIHKTPVGGLLRGFWFDSSAYDKHTAYVYVFVQPLYVPRDHLVFNFAKRLECRLSFLRSKQAWDLRDENLASTTQVLRKVMACDGLAFLRRRDTVELFIRTLRYGIRIGNSIFDREAIAYSLVWLGRYWNASMRLKALIRSVKPDDLRQDVRENAEQLLRAIQAGPSNAQDLLRRWAEETSRHLHLPTES